MKAFGFQNEMREGKRRFVLKTGPSMEKPGGRRPAFSRRLLEIPAVDSGSQNERF
jgi:hypothetical protein